MKQYPGLCRAGTAIIEEIPFHICKTLAIIYILENQLNFTTVAGSKILSEGDTEILNLKEPIQLECVDAPCKILYYSFSLDYTDSIDENFESVTYNCNICNFFGAVARPEHIESLKRLMMNLQMEMFMDAPQEVILKKSDEMLTYIRQHFDDVGHVFVQNAKVDISKERFQRISSYMIGHVTEKMSLNDIAQNEHLSLPYLSKEFSEKLEKNYNSIINYYRVINAVIQLLDTDAKLTYIAEHTGFSSIRYYHKEFKAFLHCTPSQFRAKYKGRVSKCTAEKTDLVQLKKELERNNKLPRVISVNSGKEDYESVLKNSHEDEVIYNIKVIVKGNSEIKLSIKHSEVE